MNENEIVYPVTLDYVKDWGPWQIVREFASNALDADSDFALEKNGDGALVIKSRGENLAIRHLLFGVSQKSGPDAIGQFGEGLKLALLVLTRMGLTAHIYSGGVHLWNEPAEMAGEQVFKIRWENGFRDNGQTVVGIPNWPHETFQDRFVRTGDARILHTDPFGRHILEEATPNIYAKGVWVQEGRSYDTCYAFGYNLTDLEMNRDRGVVDSWEASREIGRIWGSVTDEDLLARFWQAVKDGMGEGGCSLRGTQISGKGEWKRAFQAVYGDDVVIQTTDAMAREAQYRGAKPISRREAGGGSLADLVEDLVGTDADHVAEMEGRERVYLPDKKLGDAQRKALDVIRRLARRIGFTGKILGYILPPNVRGEAHNGSIRISVDRLGDVENAIATWLHEQAHAEYATADATAEHVNAVARVAARVITSYAVR